MEQMKKWLIASLLMLLCLSILLLLCFFQIRDLSNSISALEMDMSQRTRDYDVQLKRMWDELEELDRKGDSLLNTMNYSVGEPVEGTNTVSVQLYVVPKIQTEDMRLSVTVADVTTPLTRQEGNVFSGTLEVGLFECYDTYPLLEIESVAGCQTEYLEDMNLSYLYQDFLPSLRSLGSFVGSGEDSEHSWVGATFGFQKHTESPVTFTKITLIEEFNGEEREPLDITSQLQPSGATGFAAEYSVEYNISKNDKILTTVIAEDSLGYIHTIRFHFSAVPNTETPIEDRLEQIRDQNGNLLIGQ